MKKINIFIKNKKNLVLLILLLLSIILFIPNAKFVINMEVEGSAEANITYITPFEAQFQFSKPTYFKVNDKEKVYNIQLHARTVKKVRLLMYNNSDNFSYKINSAGIKFWFLPLIDINMQDINYSNTSSNYVADFNNIWKGCIAIPILLITIIFISLIFLSYKPIINLFKSNYIKENSLIIGIIIFFIFLEFIKINIVKKFLGTELIEHNFLVIILQIIKYDSFFIIIFLALFYIALISKSKYITFFALFIVFSLVFIYVVDLSLILLFNSRLQLIGVGTENLVPDMATIYNMVKALIEKTSGLFVILFLVYSILFLIFIAKKKSLYKITKLDNIIFIFFTVFLVALILLSDFVGFYRGKNVYYNIISVNFMNTYKKGYSDSKIQDIKSSFKYNNTCIDGLNTRKNVMIIFVESLSSYKSQLFSGLDNKTPFIDTLGKEKIYIKEYYGNGANSQLGLFSLLTGLHPITSSKIINGKESYKDSIPAHFKINGYKTVLYSGGDVTYAGTNIMAKQSGIDELYDSVYNNVYNKNDMEYVFNGVDDSVLYNSILHWMKKDENKKQPFFMVINTITTHQPYVDPKTKQKSYDKTLEFADNAVNNFITSLKENGYFENGIVVITGDHRAMLPISQQEYNKLGELAHASIPLVIINGKNKQAITGSYSHTDLGKSLEYLTLNKVCFNQFQYNIFGDNENNKCIFYQQMIDLSLVDIKCGNSYGQVLLDGDNTRFIKDELNIDNNKKQEIIDYINYMRIIE